MVRAPGQEAGAGRRRGQGEGGGEGAGAEALGLATGPADLDADENGVDAPARSASDAAAATVSYLTQRLTALGMAPEDAQNAAVASLKTYVAQNWEELAKAGIDPEKVSDYLG